ncbi:MAG: MFS transporter [Bacteroidetes bacterium GWE2_41_25]|nr:MAG: MFS transporter [Bacteroidetes bacterium GWC2_40_22]OFX96087.1 MAG: MFS transporter [Bacteroidetes bacterium GWE2_41_25]OFY58396.1 MAG: MFS transporter [Bacteroidetes bacterium GWF2_41_9]HAM10818.1 MFS transporter [Bacteroidales bacterium]HBH85171.1 MFS transporter [Bacteroidales bacterium]
MFNRKLVFWSACAGMLLFGICIITLGSVVADLRLKLNLDEISSGTLFTILPIGIIAGSLLFGPIADRNGYRLLLAVSAIIMAAGFFGIAYTGSEFVLKLYILLVGLGGGAINGATNALVSDISETGKGANISLLGVFYGIGALGMPLILALLRNVMNFEIIVASVGMLTLLTSIFYLIIKFPPPKHIKRVPFSETIKLVKNKMLLLIAFFLFFQSSYEGIINNWTTTYMVSKLAVEQSSALYALTLFVAGLVAMRLLIGSLFRSFTPAKLLVISFGLTIAGLLILRLSGSYSLSVTGLVLLGAGLAGGFPIMLGIAGNLFAELSGTAFSIIFFIALTGNTIINFLMGLVAQHFGVKHLITFALAETVIMILLSVLILKKSGNIK